MSSSLEKLDMQLIHDMWLVYGPAPDEIVEVVLPESSLGRFWAEYLEGVPVRFSGYVPDHLGVLRQRDGKIGVMDLRGQRTGESKP